MKYIKKISVAQLTSNTGTIIDSMSSGDDQHVNAPSIDAVKKYVGEYSNAERVVGTWFDKPLYRKDYNTFTTSGDNLLIDTIANINLIKVEGRVTLKFNNSGTYIYYSRNLDVVDGTMGTWRSTYSSENNNIILARASFSSQYIVDSVAVSVYYTKTTD